MPSPGPISTDLVLLADARSLPDECPVLRKAGTQDELVVKTHYLAFRANDIATEARKRPAKMIR